MSKLEVSSCASLILLFVPSVIGGSFALRFKSIRVS